MLKLHSTMVKELKTCNFFITFNTKHYMLNVNYTNALKQHSIRMAEYSNFASFDLYPLKKIWTLIRWLKCFIKLYAMIVRVVYPLILKCNFSNSPWAEVKRLFKFKNFDKNMCKMTALNIYIRARYSTATGDRYNNWVRVVDIRSSPTVNNRTIMVLICSPE